MNQNFDSLKLSLKLRFSPPPQKELLYSTVYYRQVIFFLKFSFGRSGVALIHAASCLFGRCGRDDEKVNHTILYTANSPII